MVDSRLEGTDTIQELHVERRDVEIDKDYLDNIVSISCKSLQFKYC